jgi:DNA-binding response OmpR family regulator
MDAGAKPRVLIVEDEAKTASTVALYLRHAGIDVEVALDGESGLEKAMGDRFDLIVLDVLLPGVDGREICRRVREASAVPIVMVTARATEEERIEGLDLGADDYVPKPFSPRELVARVRANLRRARLDRETGGAATPESGPPPLRRGALEIDRARHVARLSGRPLGLTAAELEILAALAERPGVVWSRERLLARLPSTGRGVDTRDARTVDAHVNTLRRTLEPEPRRPRYLVTVSGPGYKLEPPEPDGGGRAGEGGGA